MRIKTFGLSHSEQILRLVEIAAPYIKKPVIPGIECVGEIENPSDSYFHKGQRVAALMGGMGRSFNGSYAEYALLPSSHVFAADTDLSWEELAAVPETWFTAWDSLFECLKLKSSDTLLIREPTCALGYAAIQIAKALGCKVIATTHKENKLPILKALGISLALIDKGQLEKTEAAKALELVGAKTLKNTLNIMPNGGIVCHTGILGGIYALNGFDPIKDIPNGVYLTGFFSNYPTQQTITDILNFIKENNIKPKIGKIFSFDEIREACVEMDEGKVNGKIVISVKTL